jgi:hypothetical protein
VVEKEDGEFKGAESAFPLSRLVEGVDALLEFV